MGGDCRRKSSLQFPPVKTQIGQIIKIFVATEEGRFATRSNLTVTKTSFETRWLRKTRLATSRLMLVAIDYGDNQLSLENLSSLAKILIINFHSFE